MAKNEHYFQTQLENIKIQLLVIHSPQNIIDENPVLHSHQSAEVFACKEGEIDIKLIDSEIHLSAGDLAIIPPGISHKQVRASSESPSYTFSFDLTKKEINSTTDLFKKLAPFITEERILIYRNQPDALEKVENIISNCHQVPSFYPGIWLVQLLMHCIELPYEAILMTTPQKRNSARINDIQFIMAVENLVARNYDQDYNINKMAEQLHISARQLDRIIRKRYGKTLHEIFMEMRVDVAEQYIANTDMPIDKIAVTVGFNSTVGLYREFKKKHGITPTKFREKKASSHN